MTSEKKQCRGFPEAAFYQGDKDLLEQLKCTFCKLIVRDPVELRCSDNHIFCRNCLTVYLGGSRDGPIQFPCPTCKETVVIKTQQDLKVNRVTLYSLSRIRARCWFVGCNFHTTYNRLSEHVDECKCNGYCPEPMFGSDDSSKVFQIFVKNIHGKTFTIDDVEPFHTIDKVKDKLFQKTGVPANRQELYYGGKLLGNETTISQHSITGGSTLHLNLKYIPITN